jgi:uncharacterized membrane protein
MRISPAFVKVCTYCVMHFVVAIAVAYVLTRDWRIALAVGVVEPIVQTFAFAIHERLWERRLHAPSSGGACGHGAIITALRLGKQV